MQIPATLEQRISKSTGNPYFCIVIKITENTEMLAFPSPAELELIKLTYGKNLKINA